jgi:hypothetical protein
VIVSASSASSQSATADPRSAGLQPVNFPTVTVRGALVPAAVVSVRLSVSVPSPSALRSRPVTGWGALAMVPLPEALPPPSLVMSQAKLAPRGALVISKAAALAFAAVIGSVVQTGR